MNDRPVRVRFCPSPTGTPHVGLIRTALFNWAHARHTNGTFVFRIEDTDAQRDSEESFAALLDALRWLHLDWDEGPEVGGPYAPYRQSQRRDIHLDVVQRLLDAGEAYESFSTPDEVEARHRAAGRDPKLGYDNFDRDLDDAARQAYRDEGRPAVVRLRMPDADLTWHDLVRGETTFRAGTVPDFALTRGTGDPLYTLVNPVDDALMKITHVLRGEDLLSSTPRQLALYAALQRIGVAEFTPEFGHLPFVMGQGNKKLSKRDPESSLFVHRDRGFIPEGLLNYLALLGWSLAEDRDVFSLDEMVAAFDVTKVNANPARFDQKKADAINAEHIRMLAPEDFAARLRVFLAERGHLSADVDEAKFAGARPTWCRRGSSCCRTRGGCSRSCSCRRASSRSTRRPPRRTSAPTRARCSMPRSPYSSRSRTGAPIRSRRPSRPPWCEDLGLKPRKAYGPVRVAVTGSHISPPLFESLELLGRDATLARLRAALPE